jgi:hypothetical protein
MKFMGCHGIPPFAGADFDGMYPLQLGFIGPPGICPVLRWEHFAGGTFTIYDEHQTPAVIDTCKYIKTINKSSRSLGGLCDDILPEDKIGPKPPDNRSATCRVTPDGVAYWFKDAPGFGWTFGVPLSDARRLDPSMMQAIPGNIGKFAKIKYDLVFQHKIWIKDAEFPFTYKVTGEKSQNNKGSANVKCLPLS